MKTRMMAFLGLLTLTVPSAAQAPEELNALCSSVGNIAEEVMIARQEGTTMSEMMTLATESGEGLFQEILTDAVKRAYAEPAFRTEDMQRAAIRDFRNTFELECYQSLS